MKVPAARNVALVPVLLAALTLEVTAAQKPAVEIVIISSRPDMVSGGDALVEVRAPSGTALSSVKLTLNGADVTKSLRGASDRFRGLVAGMREGDNVLKASIRGGGEAALKVRNHPLTGPIVSGPHLTPYECRTEESGLGKPLDSNCSAKTKTEYFYRAAAGEFKPLADPAGPKPADLITTKTSDGLTVPYIVRVESGTINRGIYHIAFLDDPSSSGPASGSWTPGPAWNRRLAVMFPSGAGTEYNQGEFPVLDSLEGAWLSRGFAYVTSSELGNYLHANAVLQGETLLMLKEHFIERYGEPKWTVGDGLSGGASTQLLMAEMYPGVLDGLIPWWAFPDSTQYAIWDCVLLRNFWSRADPAVWTDAKKLAVSGHAAARTCENYAEYRGGLYKANHAEGCALKDASKVYDPVKNPKGARCTMQDMRANIYGRQPKTGFARRPQDNVGVQYGLRALNEGSISVSEFLDLNEQIGGDDIDGNFVASRSVGDAAAIRAAYESGLLNSGRGQDMVPILHYRAYNEPSGDFHDRVRDLVIRARLERANGKADNQVIWVGPPSAEEGQPEVVDLQALAIDTMTRWLDAIAAEAAPLSPEKAVRHKPADAVDAYWDAAGKRFDARADANPSSAFNQMYPLHADPRLVAGAPLALDIIKCQLKQIDDADYKVQFTDAEKARMKAIFPSGVCDYSRPGFEQVPLAGTYRRYELPSPRTTTP